MQSLLVASSLLLLRNACPAPHLLCPSHLSVLAFPLVERLPETSAALLQHSLLNRRAKHSIAAMGAPLLIRQTSFLLGWAGLSKILSSFALRCSLFSFPLTCESNLIGQLGPLCRTRKLESRIHKPGSISSQRAQAQPRAFSPTREHLAASERI